jgi:hypothetical protein
LTAFVALWWIVSKHYGPNLSILERHLWLYSLSY